MFQLYSNILVQGITIIAPVKSPNTDGINPGSSYKHQKNKCFDLWLLIINVSCHIQLMVNKIHLGVRLWSSGFRAPKRKLYWHILKWNTGQFWVQSCTKREASSLALALGCNLPVAILATQPLKLSFIHAWVAKKFSNHEQ